jgi:hypothetical protein
MTGLASAYFARDARGKPNSRRVFDEGVYFFANENLAGVSTYLDRLDFLAGGRVIWIGPYAEYRNEPLSVVFREEYAELNAVSVRVLNEIDARLMEAAATQSAFRYLPFRDIYSLPQSAFQGECLIFRDRDHFTGCGEELIGKSESTRSFLAGLLPMMSAHAD